MPFDVQGARRAGYSDAEIADHLASQSGFNIAAARRSGYSDAEIADHISASNAQKEREKGAIARAGNALVDMATSPASLAHAGLKAVTGDWGGAALEAIRAGTNTLRERASGGAAQADAAKNEGFLDRAGSLLERGTANVVQGGFSAIGAATGSRRARDEAANLGKTATGKIAGETTWEDVKKDPLHNIGSYAVDASLESLPGMALAAAPVVGIPAYAVTNAGNIADQRAQANGQENASFSDLLVAAPAAVASAYLEHIGPRIAATIPGKNALTGIGKAAAGEAATEFAQSVAEYTGGAIGTDKGWSAGEALDQGLAGAVAGAGMGGAIRATGESGKAVMRLSDRYSGRFRPVAPGVRATSAAEASVLTPDDHSSPIPNDLIARGKIDVADATAKGGADAILSAAGMPTTGKRVQIAMPDGTTHTGTVRDAFDTDAGDLGRASGIAVDLDNGTVFTEHFDTLKDAGVSITPHTDAPGDAGLAANVNTRPASARGKKDQPAPVDDGAALAQSIFGDKARITSGYRSADHPLSRANPNSWHTKSHAAVDMAPIAGMTFDEAKAAIEAKGYTLIEALNEVGKGRSAHATGDHWHFVIGKGSEQTGPEAGNSAARPEIVPGNSSPAENQSPTFGKMVGEPIDNEWSRFSDTSGTLGVPRAEMPQIKAEHRGAMVNFLNARGIEHQEEAVPADSLKPTQAEFSNQKVLKARNFTGGDRAILTSSDGYVLDGHHQWMGALSKGEDVRTIRLDAPIATLLKVVPEMPSATTAGGASSSDKFAAVDAGDPVGFESANGYVQVTRVGKDSYEIDRGTTVQEFTRAQMEKIASNENWEVSNRTRAEAKAAEREAGRQRFKEKQAQQNGSAVPNTGAAAPAAKVESLTDKSVIVRGLDNSEASKAIIARALPAKGIPLWNAKQGGWVVSKKHEAKIREVIAALASESSAQNPQKSATNEVRKGAESSAPLTPAEQSELARLRADNANGDQMDDADTERMIELAQRAKDAPSQTRDQIAQSLADSLGQDRGDFHNRLADAILNKDFWSLNSYLAPHNKKSRAAFTQATGVKLPATVSATKEALREWAGISKEEITRVEAESDARVAAERQKRDREYARADANGMNVNEGDQRMTGAEWVDARVADGFDRLVKQSTGAVPRYFLVNAEGRGYPIKKELLAYAKHVAKTDAAAQEGEPAAPRLTPQERAAANAAEGVSAQDDAASEYLFAGEAERAKIAERQGKEAFANGDDRKMPGYLSSFSQEAQKAWYRGWDAANLAAPISKEEKLANSLAVGEALGNAMAEAEQEKPSAPETVEATSLDDFIGKVDAGYRVHFDFAGTAGRTIWLEQTPQGWIVASKDDGQRYTSQLGGAGVAGGWTKAQALKRAEEEAKYRFTQWNPLAEAAQVPKSGTITQMPGKRTNKEYLQQGWNAARQGFTIEDDPYLATSTASDQWRKGWRDGVKSEASPTPAYIKDDLTRATGEAERSRAAWQSMFDAKTAKFGASLDNVTVNDLSGMLNRMAEDDMTIYDGDAIEMRHPHWGVLHGYLELRVSPDGSRRIGISEKGRAWIRGNQEPTPQKTDAPATEPALESKAGQKSYGTQNKLFTADAAEKARALLRSKMNQLNAGFDPEIAQAGLTLMGYHIEAGARSFIDAARAVATDLGVTPTDLRNSMRSWYSSARMWMEDNGHDVRGMDDDAAVRVDLSRIDQWGATQAAEPAIPQAEEPINGTNAEPDSTQGNDRASDGASRSAGVSASEGERKSAENPERSGNGGDGNLRADRNVIRRDPGQQNVGQGSVDSGEPRKAASRRGRAQPGDRVSKGPKPDRPDGGRNYLAPLGSIKREGGWKTTAARNLDIVELVNRLDAEQRQATPEEQALLAKFTGWGAGEIRNNLFRTVTRNPDGSRKIAPPTYGEWKELGQRASKLLAGDALETALQSTQYAHYTSEAVIRSIWSGLRRLGFNGGKIVEPGMGTGLFAVAGPSDVMGNSSYTGIELDGFTAKVASYLLPQETVIPGDYTKTKLPDGFFDIAIGNPPFADIKVTDDPAYRKQRFSLHDYFFAKTIDKVRPGGLLVFVTSRYTMDKLDPKARKYIADRADLIGAIRLPQTAFKENAGTEVVTDVLFLQRRAPGTERGGMDWLASEPITVDGVQIPINSYFAANPEMVLGQHSTTGSMYRAKEYTVAPGEQNIEQAFAKAVESLPESIYQEAAPKAASDVVAKTVEADMRPSAEKEGAVYVKDGMLFRREDGVGRALSDLGEKLNAKDLDWIKDYVPLRDAVKQAQRDQLQDGNWEKSLAALNKTYDAFVKKHGEVSAFSESERTFTDDEGNDTTVTYRRLKNRKRLDADIESTLVEALEKIGDDGKISKSPFLLGRTLKKPTRPEIKTATDAVAVTLDEIGRFDPAYVASLLGKSEKEVIAELGDEVFQHPDGSWLMADEYLSGDVVAKLDEANIAAQADPRFDRNVEALVKVQPRPLAHSDIAVKLGAGWIEAGVVETFAREVLSEEMQGIRYEPATGSWIVPDSSKRWGRTSTSEWATEDRSTRELLDAVLNNRTIKITRTEKVDGTTKTWTDQEATALANERAKKMADKFKTWVWIDGIRATHLADKYNRLFNNLAPRKFDGKHLTFPGLSTRYNLYDHQRRAIWRVIATGNTYLNHAVGAGKTLEMIVAGMEQRRLGLIRKPMYVVPNHMLNQFAREFLDAYPAANIMVADESAFHTSNRRRFMAQAALNDPDAVIVSHSSFGKIGTSAETRSRVVDRFISELEMVMDELKGQENRIARSKLEKQIEQMKRRFEGKAASEGKDRALTFEEMGVDFLFVDEAHEFRKLDFATNRTAVKGIDANGSQRALDLYIKLLWLNEQRPGRAAVLASGTPVTNTMAEIYTVMRYMDQTGLERDGLQAFDAWASMFGEVVSGFEQNAAGGYEMVERFSKFVNVPEMMKRVRSFMDVLTSEQLGDLVKRPAVKGGLPENVIAEASDDLSDYMKGTLQERIEKSRKWKPSKDQPGNPDPIINIITDGRLSAIDMRFVDPSLPSDPNSKLNKMIDKIIEKHREFESITYTDPATGKPMARKGATQIVFSAVGFGDMVAKSRGFDARAWVDKRLAEAGISRDAVAWMNDQNTHAKKEATFKAMRNAEKRVLLGSPKNMGTGVNVQARLKVLHYLSPPWYPSDVEQPHGRIIRQGNMNTEAEIYWYATKGTYDSTAWNMVSRKQRFIEQAMRGDDTIRSLEDISEANQYEMASALAAGDERVIQLAGLSNEIERLTKLEAAHAEEQVSLKWRKEALERMVAQKAGASSRLAAAIEARGPYAPFAVSVDGVRYEKPGEAGAAMATKIETALASYKVGDPDARKEIGRYQGKLPVLALITTQNVDGKPRKTFDVVVEAGPVELAILDTRTSVESIDPTGLSQRIGNAVGRLEGDKVRAERDIQDAKVELAQAQRKIGAPFEYAAELGEKIAERARLQGELASETAAAQAAAAPKASIPDDEPVADLTGSELGPVRDILDMGRKARAWFKAHLRAKTITSSDGAKVSFGRVGESKINGGDRIFSAVPAIAEIISKGEHAEPIAPSEKWAARGVIATHKYTAPVKIGDEVRRYGVLVHEMADGRRFYYLTDNPGDNVGGQSIQTEGRKYALPEVEVTADNLNLFSVDDEINVDFLPLEEIPDEWAARLAARDAQDMEMGVDARAERARYKATIDQLGSRMDQLGLTERVTLMVKGKLLRMENAAGTYRNGIIEVALSSKQAPLDTLNHEAIHALRDLGLIYDGEWAVLVRAARADSAMMASTRRRYAHLNLSEDGLVEEAIADRFKNWAANPQAETGIINRAFKRLRDFIEALGNALRRNGFRTAEDVMRAIDTGAMGEREIGAGGRGNYRASIPDETPEFDSSETERRFQEAKAGVGTTQSLIERFKESAAHTWHGLTRHWIALPNEPKYAALQQKLRAIESAPQHARERTVAMLEDMVKDFSKEDLDLFTRKVILDDLAWDAANERDLPFGFTPGSLTAEKAKIDRILMADPEQRIWKAAMKRKLANRQIAQELVAAGVLEAEQIKNPAYYRHQVLEYARAQANYARTPGQKLKTPKWAKRMGSTLDINANLLEAEFDWLNRAFVDIPVAQTIEWIKQSPHNILEQLRAEAKDSNKAGVAAKLQEAQDTIDDPQSTDDERAQAAVLIDTEQGFRQSIAMGFDLVRQHLQDGEINVPAKFQKAADAIENGKGAVGDPPFAFLSWMLDTDQPGAMGAAMVMKAIGQRRSWTKNLLGRDYINDQDAGELVKRLAPEGYRTWQPDEGKLLFTVKTLPEHAIDAMIAQLDAPAGIDPTVFRAALEGARSQLAMGGDRYTMILPEEVADTLSNLRRPENDGLFEHLAREPLRAWKRWVLINPRRFFKYNLNNLTGDLDAVLAGNPQLLKQVGRAARELADVKLGRVKASDRYNEAVARGVFDSGLSVQEIPDINTLAPFERFAKQPGTLNKVTMIPLRKAWNALQGATQWRENIFRYAAYLDYVERLERGDSQSSIGYGASRPNMVDAVQDQKDRAAMLARDLLGDYGAISHYGSWLRETVIPFWSWTEINTRRYWRLSANAYSQGVGKGIATGGGMALAQGARTSAWLAIRMAAMYGMFSLWNMLFFGDEEDELDDNQKRQMHVILGRNANGDIITLRTQGALSDALGWFGMADIAKMAKDYELGRGNLSDALLAMPKSAVNKAIGGLSPIITAPIEAAMGKKFWPDVFTPRPVNDRWRNFLSTFSLENEYDMAMDKPSRGYGRSWQEAFIYRRDPGEIAYNEARGIAYDWLKREKGQEFDGGFTSKRSEATRDYRTALRYGDHEAADKAMRKMIELGVDAGDFQQMVKRAAPLGPISKKDQQAFVASLTKDEYDTFVRAQRWYEETFLMPQQ